MIETDLNREQTQPVQPYPPAAERRRIAAQGVSPGSVAVDKQTLKGRKKEAQVLPYDALAVLLAYPDTDYPQRVTEATQLVSTDCGNLLKQFAQDIQALDTTSLQELFTQTFDLNPVCSLELGWHLFGENYERGLLLVRVRQELRRYGLEESVELPDHLTHVLRLLGGMEHERAADFAAACVLPALAKMLAAIRGKNNPFENILEAIRTFLHTQFPEIPLAIEAREPLLNVLV